MYAMSLSVLLCVTTIIAILTAERGRERKKLLHPYPFYLIPCYICSFFKYVLLPKMCCENTYENIL